MKVSIIIPVYNEEKSVGQTIKGIKQVTKNLKEKVEIIAINDCSRDGSLKVLESMKGIKVISHRSNRGYGASLKSGISVSKGEYILITDADGTYPISKIPEFIKMAPHFDMVVGWRTGRSAHIPLMRRPAKAFLNWFASFLAKKRIPDLNSGLRIFRKDLCLEFWNLYPQKFSFTSTITMGFIGSDYSVKYVPIPYFKRSGKSSMKPFDFYNFISLLMKLTLLFNPIKIFGYVAFGLVLFAILVAVLSKLILGFFMDITIIIILSSALQIFLFGLVAHMFSKYVVKR